MISFDFDLLLRDDVLMPDDFEDFDILDNLLIAIFRAFFPRFFQDFSQTSKRSAPRFTNPIPQIATIVNGNTAKVTLDVTVYTVQNVILIVQLK